MGIAVSRSIMKHLSYASFLIYITNAELSFQLPQLPRTQILTQDSIEPPCIAPSVEICKSYTNGTVSCHCTKSCSYWEEDPEFQFENGLDHCSICSQQPWYPDVPYFCEVCESGYTTFNEFIVEVRTSSLYVVSRCE